MWAILRADAAENFEGEKRKKSFHSTFWVTWLGQHELCGWEDLGFPGAEITMEVASG